MVTPIKTGAWLWRDEYNDGVWCDLYLIGDHVDCLYGRGVLVARVIGEQEPVRGDKPTDPEGLWATMHTCDLQFTDRKGDVTMHTWISNSFTIHYELQFKDGGWHSVKLT